jgi:signal peptidase
MTIVITSASLVPHFTRVWQKYMQDQTRERAKRFWKTDNYWLALLRDILVALLVVAIIISIVYAYSGTVTPLVAVESGSMEPHINIGDLVLITRPTNIITSQQGQAINYKSFGEYGDVIVYYPNGDHSATPIIHRAMYWVNAGGRLPNNQTAANAGYITKGDANTEYDQPLLLGGTPPLEPVKPDWIIGKATFAVPELGQLRLALPLIVSPPLTVSDVCRDQQIVSWINSLSARLSLSPADMGFATGAQLR